MDFSPMNANPKKHIEPSKNWGSKTLLALVILYALFLLTLRANVLFDRAGGANLLPALIQFLFPVTLGEIILLAAITVVGALKWWKGRLSQRAHPPPFASKSLTSIRNIFSKQNLAFGWSLFWRLQVTKVLLLVSQFAANAMGKTVSNIVLVLIFVSVVPLAVYFFKQQTRRRYSIYLPRFAGSFLWRAAAITGLNLSAFLLYHAAFSPGGIHGEIILLDWFTSFPVLILAMCAGLGWAAHSHIAAVLTEQQPHGVLSE
jgi:hypothetical protein